MTINKSLKSRVTLAVASLLLIFFGLVVIAVFGSFNETLDRATKQQLAANANTMLAAVAREEHGQLIMPERLSDMRFNTPGKGNLRGYIYDAAGQLVWKSLSASGRPIDYTPSFNLEKRVDLKLVDFDGKSYLVYEIDALVGCGDYGYSFVTVVPAKRYYDIIGVFKHKLFLWMSLMSLMIIAIFWLALWWSLKPFREVALQLNEIEQGQRNQLEGQFPSEVRRLTDSINTLLVAEKKQRDRYRNTMDDLTHSLKTPLMVLQSVSNTLKLQGDKPDQKMVKELRDNLNNQVNRMNQIIGYHLHRSITRHYGLKRSSVQVTPVVQDLCQSLDKVYLEKKARIQVNLDAACLFHGDEGDLLEILGNLLENAYKFCRENIRITGFVTGDEHTITPLTLVIEDDGPGIPEENHEKVLQRGVRVDCQNPGQGIGLAVVLDLVEGYQGTLSIGQSELGGALFKIRLP